MFRFHLVLFAVLGLIPALVSCAGSEPVAKTPPAAKAEEPALEEETVDGSTPADPAKPADPPATTPPATTAKITPTKCEIYAPNGWPTIALETGHWIFKCGETFITSPRPCLGACKEAPKDLDEEELLEDEEGFADADDDLELRTDRETCVELRDELVCITPKVKRKARARTPATFGPAKAKLKKRLPS